ncbi:MAG: DUF4974 domain-containing protein [Phycisphaerae bacterium]
MQDHRIGEPLPVVIRPALSLLVGLSLSAAAFAQVPRDLIEEALDQPIVELEIKDTPIRNALAGIEQRTGLHFALDDGVVDLMPYGERTRVSIEIRDMSVRSGLTRVLEGLGLRMFVRQGGIVILPAPVLDRLGRKITVAEVRLLERLAGEKWSSLQSSGEKLAVDFRIDPAQRPKEALERALAQIDASNALRQLEAACETLHWVWRPERDRIVFEHRRDEIRRRLDWLLDLTYQREPLDRLLVDLGARVGVLIKFEPGALRKVAARERTVDLLQRGTSVRQILERICGTTGLRYEIDDDGVRILAPLESTDGPTAATIQQWVRIEVQIRPGVTMDIFVRQDQLPPEFRAEAQRKLNEILHGRQP